MQFNEHDELKHRNKVNNQSFIWVKIGQPVNTQSLRKGQRERDREKEFINNKL